MSEQNVTNGSTAPAVEHRTPDETKEPVKAKTKTKAKTKAKEGTITHLTINTGNPKEFAKIVLADNDSDPRWDPRMLLKLDRDFILDLAENGVDVDLDVSEGPSGTYLVNDGKTRVRAIPEANVIRKAKGLPPIVVGLKVREREDLDAMITQVRLNEKRRESDAVTKARMISRMLDVDQTEGEIAKHFGMTPAQVETHKLLLGLPPEVQKLVTEGKLSVTAAAGVAKLDPKEIQSKANALIAAARDGKVTGAAAKRATGQSNEPDRMSAKQVKTLVAELKAADIKGKHGEAVMQAAIYALECQLDARKLEGIWEKLDKAAKG